MRLQRNLSELVAMAGLMLCSATNCFADDMADGKRQYGLRDYNKAAVSFQKALAKNGRDATAHYYMGSCYIAKRDFSEARAEYQSAADLTKDSKIRDYCESLVADIDNRYGTRGGSGSSYGGGGGRSSGGTRSNGSNDARQAIMEQAERECQALRQSKGIDIAPITGVNGDRNSAERDAIGDHYDKRMQEIQAEAQAKVRALGR